MPKTKQIPQLHLLLRQVEESVRATLKRLWGYVADSRTLRMSTLGILSRFIGKKDFRQFLADISVDYSVDSQFFSAKILLAGDIPEGAKIAIGWGPDRLVKMEHCGHGLFRVLSAK